MILWLHHKKSLIQYIYDIHFEGYAEAKELAESWKSFEGKVPERTFNCVSHRLGLQVDNANEWCDQVNSYFYRKSGIADEKNRIIY